MLHTNRDIASIIAFTSFITKKKATMVSDNEHVETVVEDGSSTQTKLKAKSSPKTSKVKAPTKTKVPKSTSTTGAPNSATPSKAKSEISIKKEPVSTGRKNKRKAEEHECEDTSDLDEEGSQTQKKREPEILLSHEEYYEYLKKLRTAKDEISRNALTALHYFTDIAGCATVAAARSARNFLQEERKINFDLRRTISNVLKTAPKKAKKLRVSKSQNVENGDMDVIPDEDDDVASHVDVSEVEPEAEVTPPAAASAVGKRILGGGAVPPVLSPSAAHFKKQQQQQRH